MADLEVSSDIDAFLAAADNAAARTALGVPAGSGNSSGNNTGDQTNITGNAGTVTSIGDLTGVVTSTNRATAIADAALSIAKTSGLQAALDGKGSLSGSNAWLGSQSYDSSVTFTLHPDAAASLRSGLGLVIGTNVQAYDADLTTWAGVTPGTGVAAALAIAPNASGGFLSTAYFTPAALTSSAGIAWDVATVRQPTLTLAHNTTITLSNLADGQSASLGGTMGGSGSYTVALAHSGLTVRLMGGDLADIATLAANDLFEISCKRVGTDLRVWISTLAI